MTSGKPAPILFRIIFIVSIPTSASDEDEIQKKNNAISAQFLSMLIDHREVNLNYEHVFQSGLSIQADAGWQFWSEKFSQAYNPGYIYGKGFKLSAQKYSI